MNVLVIYPCDSFWSMGEQAGVASFFYAAHGYIDHGHTVDVVLPGRHDVPKDEQYYDMALTRVPFNVDPLDLGPRGPVGLMLRLRRYMDFRRRMTAVAHKVSQKRRPDVVVGLSAYSAPVARSVALACGVPNITRLFGQALTLYMTDDGRIRNPIRFYTNFSEVLAFRIPCAALIVHDDGSRGDLVATRLGVPPKRFHFWRDGFDSPTADYSDAGREFKRQLGCPPDAVLAMSVGRLSPEKCLERLIEAFARAASQVPALHLVFVGDGPSRGLLENRARRAGVADRVSFAEPVPRDALGRVFSAADFTVSVSTRTNMTNAVIDAMASGVPCVAVDSGSTAAVVQHEHTGLLVDQSSTLSIAEAMCRLATDERLRIRLGNRAREFVADAFESIEDRIRREVELVTSIARNAGGRS